MYDNRLLNRAARLSVTALISVCAISAFGQCATSYQDQSTDGSSVYAWDLLTDNYTDSSAGCAPSWGGSFVHSYSLQLTVTSPSGRSTTGNSTGSANFGTGSGITRVDVSLSIDDFSGQLDDGQWSVYSNELIDCSVSGPFYNVGRSWVFDVGASVNAYNLGSQWVDPSLFRHCSYNRLTPCVVQCATGATADRVIFDWELCSPRATVQVAWIRFAGVFKTCSLFGAIQPQYSPVGCYEFPN